MYIKNSNFALYLALAAVVGFGASFLVSGLGAQSDLASGDISKAARYSNQKEDPASTVIEEKLKNDEEYLRNTKNAMNFLQSRMTTLSDLTEQTLEICSGIPEFESLMSEMQSLNAKSYNTSTALTNANAGLDKMVSGKKAPEYEMFSNQAFLGYSKVENQMELGRKFYDMSTAYLTGKQGDQYSPVADLAVVWSVYCTQDAYMNGSNKDIEYWKSKYSELDGIGGSMIRQQLEKALVQANRQKLNVEAAEMALNDQLNEFVLSALSLPEELAAVSGGKLLRVASSSDMLNNASGGVLAASATDGPYAQTREHILLADVANDALNSAYYEALKSSFGENVVNCVSEAFLLQVASSNDILNIEAGQNILEAGISLDQLNDAISEFALQAFPEQVYSSMGENILSSSIGERILGARSLEEK